MLEGPHDHNVPARSGGSQSQPIGHRDHNEQINNYKGLEIPDFANKHKKTLIDDLFFVRISISVIQKANLCDF